MKSAFLVSTSALFIALAGCGAADSGGQTGSGGKSSSSGGSNGSGGMTSGSGGTTSGSGGSGSGGSNGSGGSTGSGGASDGSGGSTGSGGMTSGSGGSNIGGSTGSGGRTGGTTGSGGASTGSGGAASTGTGGASSGDLLSVVGEFDGYLFTAPCGGDNKGYDCANSGCTSGNPKTTTKEFPIGGTQGKIYNVTFNVRGIVEAKNYSGGTRRAGTTMTYSDTADFWYEGGTVPNSTYNSYELHVTPKVDGAKNDYYLNARDGSGEGHQSWKLGYSATIKVPGGGKITYRVYDSNCRQITNCGPAGGGSTCPAPGSVSLAGAMPPPPSSFTQPFYGGGTSNGPGQWVFIDVTSVTEAN